MFPAILESENITGSKSDSSSMFACEWWKVTVHSKRTFECTTGRERERGGEREGEREGERREREREDRGRERDLSIAFYISKIGLFTSYSGPSF